MGRLGEAVDGLAFSGGSVDGEQSRFWQWDEVVVDQIVSADVSGFAVLDDVRADVGRSNGERVVEALVQLVHELHHAVRGSCVAEVVNPVGRWFGARVFLDDVEPSVTR